MGIDWYRYKIKPDVDRALLDRFIEQQAIAFQSMSGWHADSDRDKIFRELLYQLHHETYRNASAELSNLLELPKWNDERKCSEDISDLAPCWRVYPITDNPIFPPFWRMSAHQTYLPEQLKGQLEQWKNWIEEVKRGEHEDYLRELHLYGTLDFMKYHWSYLRDYAVASLSQTGNWAKKPKLREVRDLILPLPEPAIELTPIKIYIDPQKRKPGKQDSFDSFYEEVFDNLRRLIELTRTWDSSVRGNWNVGYYEDSYYFTFDKFRERAFDDWLQEFFQWAERCVALEFGFYHC